MNIGNIDVSIKLAKNNIVIYSSNGQLLDTYMKIVKMKKYNKKTKKWLVPVSKPSIQYVYKLISALNKIKGINLDVDLKIADLSLDLSNKIKDSYAIEPKNKDFDIPLPDNLTLLNFQKAGIEYIENNQGNVLLADEMGTGKMSDVNSDILTPFGWRTLGTIEINDKIIGSDGNIYEVTGVFPQGNQDAYKIYFDDGTTHVCGLEHLWGVFTKKGYEVLDTKTISENGLTDEEGKPNYFLPIVKPINFYDKRLPESPYSVGYRISKNNDMNAFLKHEYLYSKVRDRIELLQGLLDRQSSIPKYRKYSILFSHKSVIITDQVAELVRSLGGIAYNIASSNRLKLTKYNVGIILPKEIMPFKSIKLLKEYLKIADNFKPMKYIKKIRYIGKRRMLCISVNSRDSLYVVDSYNLTHNTIQTAAWMNIKIESKLPALVICPKSATYNWEREIKKWSVNDVSTHVIEAKKKHKIEPNIDYYIVNYDLIDKIKRTLSAIKFKTIILDEVHMIKSSVAKRSKATIELAKNIDYKLCLSGTPIKNRPIEIFTVINLLMPNFFKSKFEYGFLYCGAKRGYQGRWEFKGYSNPRELQDLLRSTIMIRRLKVDVLKELPEKIRSFVPIKNKISKEYSLLEEETINTAKDYVKLNEEKRNVNETDKKLINQKLKNCMNIMFTNIQKLRIETFNIKKDYIISSIIDVLENDEPVVVFVYHRDAFSKIKKELEKKNFIVSGFTGEHSGEFRLSQVDEFQEGKSNVFITTIGAGSEVITLTRASHIIMAEISWIPSQLLQAEDRCYRIGQKNAVNIYYIVLEQSIDMKMVQIVEKKFKSISTMLNFDVNDESDIDLFSNLVNLYV